MRGRVEKMVPILALRIDGRLDNDVEGRSTELPRGVDGLQDRGIIVKVNRLFRW